MHEISHNILAIERQLRAVLEKLETLKKEVYRLLQKVK